MELHITTRDHWYSVLRGNDFRESDLQCFINELATVLGAQLDELSRNEDTTQLNDYVHRLVSLFTSFEVSAVDTEVIDCLAEPIPID